MTTAGLQLVVVRMILQRLGDARIQILRLGRQVDIGLGAAIDWRRSKSMMPLRSAR